MSANDVAEFLGSTSVTSGHVQQAFREYLNDNNVRLDKVDADTIAAGQGFTSYILRLTFTWSDEDKNKHGTTLPKSAILKALSKDAIEKLFDHMKLDKVDGARDDFTQMLVTGHKTECAVYEMFDKKNGTPPVPIAQAYATRTGDSKHPPMILMEDLGERGRVLGDGSASLTYPQLLSLAEAQASLHAWCLTTKENWRDKFDKFADRLHLFAAFLPMLKQGLQKAKEVYPDEFGRVDETKWSKLFEPETMLKMHDTYKPWMPDVLVHGDFWANNIMFNKLPDGSMGNEVVAFIDWQLPHLGNPMIDLGRMLSMSVDPDLRDMHMEDVIRRYYDCLEKKLGEEHMPKGLTFERVLKWVNEYTAISCLMLFVMHDAMHALFAPGDGPEAEAKRARMIKRAKGGFEYAEKILDISD